MKKNSFVTFFFIIIPKAFLSRIFGHFAKSNFSSLFIKKFAASFKINREECIEPENGFNSLNSFFTRKLIPGMRKIDISAKSLVSPVDGRIDQFGPVTGTRVMQAKDIDYLLAELLPAQVHHLFIDGSFITIYLSPSDYHRIHSPLDGKIFGTLYVPGKLFPVMEYMVNGINGLFTKNERAISYIETSSGKCVVAMVGAMNVGQISISYENIITNQKMFRKKNEILYPDNLKPQVHKGDEIGIFNMGSTVIMLFEKDMVEFSRFNIGDKVKMGQKIGTIR